MDLSNLIPDGTYTHADLTALKSRQLAFYGTVPTDVQEELTRSLHDFALAALEQLEQAQTYTETEAELAVRVEGGKVAEIVKAD